MLPVLFHIGPIPIHTYGLLIAIGFLVAIEVIKRLTIRSGLDVDRVLDLTFWLLAIGFVGARLLFVVTLWEQFARDPLAIFKVWEGGLVFFGGPLACFPFAVWYLRKHKLPMWRTMDSMIPGLAIAHAFGRLGCLAAGCCYGKPTGGEWGIKLYSDLVDKSMQGIYLHPTQLYESFSMFVLFAGLIAIYNRKKFDGQVVLVYFCAYPIIRSVIEIFRGDTIRGFVIDGWLSTSQFISVLVFAAAAFFMARRLKQVKRGQTAG